MDYQEIVNRYKDLPVIARLVGCAVIPGFLVAAMNWGDIESLREELLTADEAVVSEKTKLDDDLRKKKELPKLKSQQHLVEDQIDKGKEKLPENIDVADMLAKVATIAKEVGIEIISFSPKQEKTTGTGYKYIEMPVDLTIRGSYVLTATFIERLLKLSNMVNVRNIAMSHVFVGAPTSPDFSSKENINYENAKLLRDSTRVKTETSIVMFKASDQGNEIDDSPLPGEEKETESDGSSESSGDE